MPEEVSKSFSLQFQVFGFHKPRSASSGVWATSSSSSGSADPATNFGGLVEGPALRAKMLRAFQHNLLADATKRELAAQLNAHVLVLVL